MENWKIYLIAIFAIVALGIGGLFFYRWYTKPKIDQYCGKFNQYACAVGKCDYMVAYETGPVGYCRNTLFGF